MEIMNQREADVGSDRTRRLTAVSMMVMRGARRPAIGPTISRNTFERPVRGTVNNLFSRREHFAHPFARGFYEIVRYPSSLPASLSLRSRGGMTRCDPAARRLPMVIPRRRSRLWIV